LIVLGGLQSRTRKIGWLHTTSFLCSDSCSRDPTCKQREPFVHRRR
jgi:hypothetical protein